MTLLLRLPTSLHARAQQAHQATTTQQQQAPAAQVRSAHAATAAAAPPPPHLHVSQHPVLVLVKLRCASQQCSAAQANRSSSLMHGNCGCKQTAAEDSCKQNSGAVTAIALQHGRWQRTGQQYKTSCWCKQHACAPEVQLASMQHDHLKLLRCT